MSGVWDMVKGMVSVSRRESRSPPGAAPTFRPTAGGGAHYPGPSIGLDALAYEYGKQEGVQGSAAPAPPALPPPTIEAGATIADRMLSWRSRAHGPLVASSPNVSNRALGQQNADLAAPSVAFPDMGETRSRLASLTQQHGGGMVEPIGEQWQPAGHEGGQEDPGQDVLSLR